MEKLRYDKKFMQDFYLKLMRDVSEDESLSKEEKFKLLRILTEQLNKENKREDDAN